MTAAIVIVALACGALAYALGFVTAAIMASGKDEAPSAPATARGSK